MINSSIQPLAVEFLKNKDNKSFKKLIERIRPGLMAFTYNILQDTDMCEDILSKTFIKIWEKIDKYNPEFKFSTWVYTIAKHEAYGLLREKKKKRSYEKMTEDHSKVLKVYSPKVTIDMEVIGPSGEELTKMLYEKTIEEIKNLDEPYRSAMIEREIKNKELSEIAEDLDWNLNTVKTRVRKGRKLIADTVREKHSYLYNTYYFDND